MLATLLVAWIVYAVLVKSMKTKAKTAFIAAVSIVLLEAGFGISPKDVWQQIMYPSQNISTTTAEK
jgi:hypothetical protein